MSATIEDYMVQISVLEQELADLKEEHEATLTQLEKFVQGNADLIVQYQFLKQLVREYLSYDSFTTKGIEGAKKCKDKLEQAVEQ